MTILTGKSKRQTKPLRYSWCCHLCGKERGLTIIHTAGGKVAVCKEHNK
jgi:hypothetical protein